MIRCHSCQVRYEQSGLFSLLSGNCSSIHLIHFHPPPRRTSSLLITHHIGRHTNDDNQQRGPMNTNRKDWNRDRRRRNECPHVDAWSTAGSVSFNKDISSLFWYLVLFCFVIFLFFFLFFYYLPFSSLHFVFTSLSVNRLAMHSASAFWRRCTLRYRHRSYQVYVISSFTFSPPSLLPPLSLFPLLSF